MFAAKNLHRHCSKSLSSLLRYCPSKSVVASRGVSRKLISSYEVQLSKHEENGGLSFSSSPKLHAFSTWHRSMSSSSPRGRSMRSKVEKRMQKETGKTMREVRRAKKIQKKLMTENERLVYNLKRAKRKVAVLLQKLKKYELPELPPPKHDPEILTPEQLQAYKKIGFKNKNYVTVGVRGVFGGVVQNLHMHWKFHETVQVCCDNFPKEKIKEMAMMIARLSGGIVVNIHNVKTIIMYRGRNYRQPKNLIPINTLTKRKALFKARFEQALESQKLNIKKFEQQLRRSGINPEDPIATASIQRVAASFFNAIDKKEGTPYIFREDKLSLMEPSTNYEQLEPTDEREQAEIDKFIADIEDAAEREWAAEEAAEKEDQGRIRYWNREEFSGRFRRFETRDDRSSDRKPRAYESDDEENDEWQSRNNEGGSDSGESDEGEKFPVPRRGNEKRENFGGFRNPNTNIRKSVVEMRGDRSTDRRPRNESDDEENDDWQSRNNEDGSDSGDSDEGEKFLAPRRGNEKREKLGGYRNPNKNIRKSVVEEESETFRHLDKAMWQSGDDDEEHDSSIAFRPMDRNYMSESDEEEFHDEPRIQKAKIRNRTGRSISEEEFDSGDSCSDLESDWIDGDREEDERYQVRKGSETMRMRDESSESD